MSWSVLPVEVTLEIIEYLCPEINVGQIGKAAAWTKLWQTNNTDMEAEQNSNEGGGSEGVLSGSTQALSTNPWSALQSLALTNKYFYKLCIPFAHRDFVFTSNDWTPITDELVSKWVKHGGNVRNVRILLDPGFTLLFRYWEFLATTLATFTNVTSLALYYRSCHSLPRKVAEECVNILKTAWKPDLGSTHGLDGIRYHPTILEQCRCRQQATRPRPRIGDAPHGDLQPPLRYQTLGRIWDANQLPYWKYRDNLTCLRLIDCSNAYAFHIPHLVRHFTSLRELMVSTCGASDDDTVGVQRSGGWSTESDALRNTHAPLEVFHIEHMTDWEIYALGVIPTKELSTSLITRGHLEAAFTRDPEIFPGLVLLRVEEYVNLEETTYREPTMANAPRTIKTLNAICTGRGIKVEKDAKWIRRKYIA